MDGIKSQRLSIFLLKNKDETDGSIVKDSGEWNRFPISVSGFESSILYVKKVFPKPPRWADLFVDQVPKKEFGNGQSPGAILIMRGGESAFVVPFGRGRFSLNDDIFVRDFGLKIVLNVVAEKGVRSIDTSTFQKLPMNSRLQSSKGVEIDDLDVDKEADLLYAMTGISEVEIFGQSVSGRDALIVNTRVSLEQLADLLSQSLVYYKSKKYEGLFSWVDNIKKVRDEDEIKALDELLVEKINSGSLEVVLCEPAIVDWEVSCGYRYGTSARYPRHDFMDFLAFKNEVVKGKRLTLDDLRKKRIHLVDEDFMEKESWSVYRCIYCEMGAGEEYVLRGGDWYKVNSDFYDRVNRVMKDIEFVEDVYPSYEADYGDEGDYNKALSSAIGGFLYDADLIYFTGGKIEFCDVLKDKDVIHVKKYRSSQQLSHLFSQGVVSAITFKDSLDFVTALSDKNKKLGYGVDVDELRKGFSVVYGIIACPQSLPFFSKVTLKSAFAQFNRMNVRVKVVRISVDEIALKKGVHPPAK